MGTELSTRPCLHLAATLAENATCGARCPAFPACLPPASPEVAAGIVRLHLTTHGARVHAATVSEALELLHGAITEGLARKELPPA